MNLPDLSPYFNKIDLIKDTASQLIKDFEMFGLEIQFSGNVHNAYNELFEQVEPHINQLITVNRQKFMSILYRIDLSDEQIKKAVNSSTSASFSAVVSHLIIKRELQKVVIRKHYKKR